MVKWAFFKLLVAKSLRVHASELLTWILVVPSVECFTRAFSFRCFLIGQFIFHNAYFSSLSSDGQSFIQSTESLYIASQQKILDKWNRFHVSPE